MYKISANKNQTVNINDVNSIYLSEENYKNSNDIKISENQLNIAKYVNSEGYNTNILSDYTHAEGCITTAGGVASHAEGLFTRTSSDEQNGDISMTGIKLYIEQFFIPENAIQIKKDFLSDAMINYLHAGQRVLINDYGNDPSAYCNITNVDTTNYVISLDSLNGLTLTSGLLYLQDYALASHAEGIGSISNGATTHSEGFFNIAQSSNSHAEGKNNLAIYGKVIPAPINVDNIGKILTFKDIYDMKVNDTIIMKDSITNIPKLFNISAIDDVNKTITLDTTIDISSFNFYDIVVCYNNNEGSMHTEGINNTAIGIGSHTEGNQNITIAEDSHAEGVGNVTAILNNLNSTQTGIELAFDTFGVDDGNYIILSENPKTLKIMSALSIGDTVNLYKSGSGSEFSKIVNIDLPNRKICFDNFSDSFKTNVSTSYGFIYINKSAWGAHVEGINNIVNGVASHAEGFNNIAFSSFSHVEGRYCIAAYGTLISGSISVDNNIKQLTFDPASDISAISPNSIILFRNDSYNIIKLFTVLSVDNTNKIITLDTTEDILDINGESFVVWNNAWSDTIHAEGNKTIACGSNSHAEGDTTIASGSGSHAEGSNTLASGNNSHAEGTNTLASGIASHAEGTNTKATNNYSHAEGNNTEASGIVSHAEGANAVALGAYSHVEGDSTQAKGIGAHAEGLQGRADGDYSHVEGDSAWATGYASHAEGSSNARKDYAHAEGEYSGATGYASHAEGGSNANGDYSHSEGQYSQAIGNYSHAEGNGYAEGIYSHSEGEGTRANAEASHAEGKNSRADGNYSHAEGCGITEGDYSHAEGEYSRASGEASHAEGSGSADANYSHSEGEYTRASGEASHAEGEYSSARGFASHAEGLYTDSMGDASHAEGEHSSSIGTMSHAEGKGSQSYSIATHTEGYGTLAALGELYTVDMSGSTTDVSAITLKAINGKSYNLPLVVGNPISMILNSVDENAVPAYYNKITSVNGLTIGLNYVFNDISTIKYVLVLDCDVTHVSASHAEGNLSMALGYASHAEGESAEARGEASHAEGVNTLASGDYSHVEGGSTASGDYSHAEGQSNESGGRCSHAEGIYSTASGEASHAEGQSTASGYSSHSEGYVTESIGDSSHAEGFYTIANGNYSHAEGFITLADSGELYTVDTTGVTTNVSSLSLKKVANIYYQLSLTVGSKVYAIISSGGGFSNILFSYNITAVNGLTITLNTVFSDITKIKYILIVNPNANETSSHAEGLYTIVGGANSHAEGRLTVAACEESHAEGAQTQALGASSHAEGRNTIASFDAAHAEGQSTIASGRFSHSEGMTTTASGDRSHAEGVQSIASGDTTHAEGCSTTASGDYSHAEGYYTTVQGTGSHIMGKYGTISDNYAFALANGTSTSALGLAVKMLSTGQVFADGAYSGTGADYAEMFEWEDGNPNGEDRVGKFVTLVGDKIRIANSEDDYVLGVVSAVPTVIGDTAEMRWNGKYITDNFGRTQYQEVTIPEVKDGDIVVVPQRTETQPILNPNWDGNEEYIPRSQRKEWSPIGVLGKLLVLDDGTCLVNNFCTPDDNGVAILCDKSLNIKFRVIKRVANNIVMIFMK